MVIAPRHSILSTPPVATVAKGVGLQDDDGVRMLAECTATDVGPLRATKGRGVPVLDTEGTLTGFGLLRPDLLALVAELCTKSGMLSSSLASSSWESFSKSEKWQSLPLVLIADGGADVAVAASALLTFTLTVLKTAQHLSLGKPFRCLTLSCRLKHQRTPCCCQEVHTNLAMSLRRREKFHRI